MTEHDPMAVLPEAEVAPDTVDPWQALARQAQWLAAQADRLAALTPAERIARDEDGDEADELSMLDARELALRGALAACRRSTYQQLLDTGWTVQQIADELDVSYQAVRKVLNRGRRS